MIANYHTHTWRCHHAKGTEREYVERAIEGGLKILGFSDHTPYPLPAGYHSPNRMEMDKMDGYVDTVLSLKKEYQADIEIHLGLETEYYPAYWEQLLDFLSDYPVEYMLLGQHYLGNEVDSNISSGQETSDGARLKQYVDQCTEAMETGRFLYVAHPDLLNFTGDAEVFDREYRRLCWKARELDIPLEINMLGLWDHRPYPREDFWKIAGEEGCRAVIGCDAHLPENAWRPDIEQLAVEMARRNHLTPEEWLPVGSMSLL